MMRLDEKVALVTGGGGGLGRGICASLAEAGAKVVVAGRKLETLEETVEIIRTAGGDAIVAKLDVTSEEHWHKATKIALSHFGKLNVLVNNAGIYCDEPCEELSYVTWRNINAINYDGSFLGIRAGLRVMKDNDDKNSIINIASVAGIMPGSQASYSSSKAGMLMLSKCASVECQQKGYDNIRVNAILPGIMKDGMGNHVKEDKRYQKLFVEHMPPSSLGTSEDVASATLFLASDTSRYITGSEIIVDGGLSTGAGGHLVKGFRAALRAEA